MAVRETLRIHNTKWEPVHVPITTGAAFRFVGVDYMLDGKERPQFEHVKAQLRGILTIIHTKQATPATVMAVLRSSTISKIAYIGALAPWPLEWYAELDTLLAREYRYRTKNMTTAQRTNLFVPAETGGLGLPSLLDIIQARKKGIVERALAGTATTQLAADLCLSRAGSDQPSATFWATSC